MIIVIIIIVATVINTRMVIITEVYFDFQNLHILIAQQVKNNFNFNKDRKINHLRSYR